MIKTVIIADLGKIITGNTPSRNKPELYGKHTPFIKATDIMEGNKYTFNSEECYSEEGYNKYFSSLIPKGSTCVVTIGSIGKKMTMAHCDCFINQAMNAIVPNDDYDPEYVYYAIKNIIGNLKSLDSGTASGRENVSKSAFSKMPINIESDKSKQIKIGKILSAYDDLIENNQKQIKLLEEAAQRLYKEWFVDLRFPGYENTHITDGVPQGWKNGILDDIVFESGKNEKKENRENYLYYLPIDCLPKQSIGYTDTSDICLAESSLVAFSKNDIIFGAMRPYFHKVVVARDSGLTRSTCFVLNARESAFWAYVTMLMSSKDTVDYATQISVGTTMPYARWKDLKQMPIIIPTAKLAEEFQKNIKPIIDKIEVLSKAIMALRETRDCLLPKLMSGELEV